MFAPGIGCTIAQEGRLPSSGRPYTLRFLPTRVSDRTSPSGGGKAWRVVSTAILAILGSIFIAEIIARPTKRNIEALIGIIFIGLGIQAPVIVLCAFAVLLLP